MKLILFCLSLLAILIIAKASPKKCRSLLDINSNMNGTCQLIDACKGAAISGNCNEDEVCCVSDEKPSYAGNALLTKEIFLNVVGDTPRNNEMYYYLTESFEMAEIKTEYQIAAYLSQLIGETDGFKKIESTQLESDFNPAIGNNQTGDGIKYRGRGGILLRGRNNYLFANNKLTAQRSGKRNDFINYNLVENPEKTALPSVAFKVAAWFWRENAFVIKSTEKATKSSLNQLADGTFLSFTQLTYSLTNKIKSLKERALLNEQILEQFRSVTMKRGSGVNCQQRNGEIGYAVPICLMDFKKPYCGCEGQVEMRSCPYGRLTNGDCRNSAIIKCCVEKCYNDLDLVIMIDTSGSMTEENFDEEINFVKTLIKQKTIGENATRVALVQFNTRAVIHTDFRNGTSIQTLNAALDSMKFRGGQTNTAEALQFADERILREDRGMRPVLEGIPKVVLTITDGLSDNPPLTKKNANKLRNREINMVSVGIGEETVLDELYAISTTPSDQYYVEDFSKILRIINELSSTTCKQPAAIPEETNITSRVEKDSYKYYKYPVPLDQNDMTRDGNHFLKDFTIMMEELDGSSNLYFSFEEMNPKSEDDYVQDKDSNEKEHNFIEDPNSLLKRNSRKNKGKEERQVQKTSSKDSKKKYYHVENPKGQDTLYISVVGKNEKNTVEITVNTTKSTGTSTISNLTTKSTGTSTISNLTTKSTGASTISNLKIITLLISVFISLNLGS